MFKNLLILTCCVFGIAANAKFLKPLQSPRFIVFDNGSCWDAATGVDIKSRVYAIVGNNKTKIGESNSDGLILNLPIPTNSQFLVFESDGYETIKKQTHFIGSFLESSKFIMSLPMLKRGTVAEKLPTKQKFNRNPETAIFCIPNDHTTAIDYELLHAKNRSFCTNFSELLNAGRSENIDLLPNHYILVVRSKSGQLLMEKDLAISEGLSFIDIHIENQNKDILAQVDDKQATIFNNRILYFDQSSYDLKTEVKATLDSAAEYLLNHPKGNVSVVGYTDNVGNKNLNVALSEFRARAVAGYLTQKGVQASQIRTKWKGPDSLAVFKNTEENKVKSRRVVIQIIKE